MTKFPQYLSILLIIILLPLFSFAENTFEREYQKADEVYQRCFDALPAKIRVAMESPSARGWRRWSKQNRDRVEGCLRHKRVRDDFGDKQALSRDLKGLYKKAALNDEDERRMSGDAEDIAATIIDRTRELSYEYNMASVALWHNFLIKIGAREKGYCYQWAEELFDALPNREYTFFERHWGVHNKDHVTENNAVIITRRGGDISGGIVYDPWRGKGRPFWRMVGADSQTWSELLTERQILTGQR